MIFIFELINSNNKRINNKRILFKKLTQSIVIIESYIFIDLFCFVCVTSTKFFLQYLLSFLLMKTIEFIIIFFITIVTNNIFESSNFISFSFSFNIIAYFALIINVNFVLIRKLRIELIVKFIRKSFWFVEKIFEKFELNKIIFVLYARAFQSFLLHNNFNQIFFASIKYFINI